MTNTALAFAFCDRDSDTDEMARFMNNTDSKELLRLLDITKEAFNSIVQFIRDDSFRFVVCSSKYIKKVKRYGRHVDSKLDGTTECMCYKTQPSISIAYSVKSNNKILKFLPKEIANGLTPRVTVIFIEYSREQYTADNADVLDIINFIHMINIAKETMMSLFDKMVENSVIEGTENPDGAKSKQLKNCLDAYREYRYSKINNTMSVDLINELKSSKIDKIDPKYFPEIHSNKVKINDYMRKVDRSIHTHKVTDSTFNYFARAVGNTAILSKLKLQSETKLVDFERARYMNLIIGELEEMVDVYFDVIHRMLFGNFDITNYINKLKVNEKALYAINNKLRNIGR